MLIVNQFAGFGGFGGVKEPDPYFSSVSALLHFNGADGATSTVDSGPISNTPSLVGHAQLDTAQAALGSSSLLLDGNGDYCTIPHHASLEFGSSDFTVEFRLRIAALPAHPPKLVVGKSISGVYGAFYIQLNSSGQLAVVASSSNTSPNILSFASLGSAISTNTWYSVALVRSGTNFYGYLDGARTTLGTSAAALYANSYDFQIGTNFGTSANDLAGWIDEFRVTKGVARYTAASYVVATTEFPDS
jgi:hypothetical protein